MRGKGVKSVRGGAQGDLLCRGGNAGRSERKQKQLLKDLQESFGGPTERKQPAFKSFDGVKNS